MNLDGVREYGEGYAVELAVTPETNGRVCVRAFNEGHNGITLVDLLDLLEWLKNGPEAGRTPRGFRLPIGGNE